ncbi:unnamed protein product [Dovyalis caffra]|uniref:Neprosin PEP catalytic domain-containing protein n=1 Tax=Dovyalis caffra TaxID=77055 RepID=A0AAV1R5H6_9ROSI|nr:unnamed protein product [Dovyalis caffra]
MFVCGRKLTTTEMGRGHFPPQGFGKAGYFRNLQAVDGSKKLEEPTNIGTSVSQSKCYDIQTGKEGDWD